MASVSVAGLSLTAPAPSPVAVTRISLPLIACPVAGVTVFNDRAEVCRTVATTLTNIGQHDISVEGFSRLADADSLRYVAVRTENRAEGRENREQRTENREQGR